MLLLYLQAESLNSVMHLLYPCPKYHRRTYKIIRHSYVHHFHFYELIKNDYSNVNCRILYYMGFYDFLLKMYGKEKTEDIISSIRDKKMMN